MEKLPNQDPRKSRTWLYMSERSRSWTDRLGRPIDAEIHDAVMALNVLGFGTVSSCAGHSDRPGTLPYVDVAVPSHADLMDAITAAAAVRECVDQLLAEYYSDRTVPPDMQLRTSMVYADDSPAGISISSPPENSTRLEALQADMENFTTFLVSKIDTEQ